MFFIVFIKIILHFSSPKFDESSLTNLCNEKRSQLDQKYGATY